MKKKKNIQLEPFAYIGKTAALPVVAFLGLPLFVLKGLYELIERKK